MTPKSQAIKDKVDKLDLIKVKNFCVSKDIINKMKRDNSMTGKIYVQIKYLIRELYPDYIKNT